MPRVGIIEKLEAQPNSQHDGIAEAISFCLVRVVWPIVLFGLPRFSAGPQRSVGEARACRPEMKRSRKQNWPRVFGPPIYGVERPLSVLVLPPIDDEGLVYQSGSHFRFEFVMQKSRR